MFQVTVRHDRGLEDARKRLEAAVAEVKEKFGAMLRKVEWSADRNAVTLEGSGVVVSLKVDPSEVHVSGDVPILGMLLGKPLEAGLKQIVGKAFGKTGIGG